MADITDLLSALVGGAVVGLFLWVLDFWRSRKDKNEEHGRTLGEDLVGPRTTINELKLDVDGLRNDVSQLTTFHTSTQTALGKLETSQSIVDGRFGEIERRVSKTESRIDSTRETLEGVRQVANEARAETHKHVIFGEKA